MLRINSVRNLSYLDHARLGKISRCARLCENFIGALRLGSGQADKYLDLNEAIPFVVSFVEP
jgi:hypothetical protein